VRYVICTLGGDRDPWQLPASSFSDRVWIHGGERGLYELAAAIASLGKEVELRGDLLRPELDRICTAASAYPRTGLPERRPHPEDVVIVPEGWPDPLAYARIALSPARAVLLMLAPPGLFGWPFVSGWTLPDPLTVPISDLARPEHFRSMRALGFTLWTHSRGIVNAAEAAGVPCHFIGEGQPALFQDVPPKTTDVVFIAENRWAPLARKVVRQLRAQAEPIPGQTHGDLLRGVAAARILLLPSRVEGTSRLQWEARALGTVPVALATNPFAEGLDEEGGAVVVGSVEEMAGAIDELLDRPDRLRDLSERATRTAREQVDWETYRARVTAALDQGLEEDPAHPARGEMGRVIHELLQRRLEEAREARREVTGLRSRRAVRLALRLANSLRPLRRRYSGGR
jgi:glycosyltransferase involved in cell wall biosynthesis